MKSSVLVVVGDLVAMEELKLILQENYRVIEAATAEEALALAELHTPDLIIMDDDLPDDQGLKVFSDLKSGVLTRTIPLLALSAASTKAVVINGLAASADDYLTKPVNSTELLTKVDAYLRNKDFYDGLEPGDFQMLLELSTIISLLKSPTKILQTIVERIAQAVGARRCSVLSFSTSQELLVKASSDLPKTGELRLELRKYPEISQAIKTRKTVVINDVTTDPLMAPVRDQIINLPMNSIIVVPIVNKESILGTFLLRTVCPLKKAITERVYKLSHLAATMSFNALENAALYESMLNKQRYLEKMSLRDGLTTLYNHQHFYTRIEEEFSRAARYNTALSCLFLDLDDFKKINDNYGHVCGDEVLRQIGRMLSSLIRDSDIAARYGGEEFVLILPNTLAEGALEMANRLRAALNEIVIGGLDCMKITASIGIATYIDGNLPSYKQLITEADDAMYQSKKLGKDRVTVGTA